MEHRYMSPIRPLRLVVLLLFLQVLSAGPGMAWENTQTHVAFNQLAFDYFMEKAKEITANPYKYHDMAIVSTRHLIQAAKQRKEKGAEGQPPFRQITDGNLHLRDLTKHTPDLGLSEWGNPFMADDQFALWVPTGLVGAYKDLSEPLINPPDGFLGQVEVHDPRKGAGAAPATFEHIVVVGGDYADYPVIDQALRHFYDPLKITGKHSLTDTFGYPAVPMDLIEWTFTAPTNAYCLEKARQYMRNAFATPDETTRAREFGKAYRSLGQAIHLASDLACPPHVRNDGHPYSDVIENVPTGEILEKALQPYRGNTALVDNRLPAAFCGNSPGGPFLLCHLGLPEIFRATAKYVNARFFSDETISDAKKGILPKPFHQYPKPQISDLNQGLAPGVYSGTFARFDGTNAEVPLAEETLTAHIETTKIINNSDGFLEESYHQETRMVPGLTVSTRFVPAQLDILAPLCIRIGAEVIDRFIPALRLELNLQHQDDERDRDPGVKDWQEIRHRYKVTGALVHDRADDDFWGQDSLKYTGSGVLYLESRFDGNRILPLQVSFKDGLLEPINSIRVDPGGARNQPEAFNTGAGAVTAEAGCLGNMPGNVEALAFVKIGSLVVRSPLTQVEAPRIEPFRIENGSTFQRMSWTFTPIEPLAHFRCLPDYLPYSVRHLMMWDLVWVWSITGPETVSLITSGPTFFHAFARKGEYVVSCRLFLKSPDPRFEAYGSLGDEPLGEARAYVSITQEPQASTDYHGRKTQPTMPSPVTGGESWEKFGPSEEEAREWYEECKRAEEEEIPPKAIQERNQYLRVLRGRYGD